MDLSFFQTELFNKVVTSAVLILVALVMRKLAVRAILRVSPKSEMRRRWVVSIRNATVAIAAIGLIAVWFEALEGFGTAILAVAVAFVIAIRELIQNTLGAFFRTVSNTYTIGNRIEIGSHRGDVVDQNLLTTTILEVGPGKSSHLRTGRTIVIPNMKLLDSVVVNESNMGQFVVHYFTVPIRLKDDWKRAETVLLEAAESECDAFIEDARRHMERLERRHGLMGLPLRPRVSIEINQPDRINLLVRVPAVVGNQGKLEQAILRHYLEDLASQPKRPDSESSETTPVEAAADGG